MPAWGRGSQRTINCISCCRQMGTGEGVVCLQVKGAVRRGEIREGDDTHCRGVREETMSSDEWMPRKVARGKWESRECLSSP